MYYINGCQIHFKHESTGVSSRSKWSSCCSHVFMYWLYFLNVDVCFLFLGVYICHWMLDVGCWRWPSDLRKLNVEHFWENPHIATFTHNIWNIYTAKSSLPLCPFVWFFKYFWATDTSDHWPFGPLTLQTIDLSDQWPFGLMTLRTNALELNDSPGKTDLLNYCISCWYWSKYFEIPLFHVTVIILVVLKQVCPWQPMLNIGPLDLGAFFYFRLKLHLKRIFNAIWKQ